MKKVPEKLYKYRSLSGDSFKYTMDILLNNRIYMPSRKSLNDPFEGVQNINLGMSGNPSKQDKAEIWEKLMGFIPFLAAQPFLKCGRIMPMGSKGSAWSFLLPRLFPK